MLMKHYNLPRLVKHEELPRLPKGLSLDRTYFFLTIRRVGLPASLKHVSSLARGTIPEPKRKTDQPTGWVV
jgi:hypothetical protein